MFNENSKSIFFQYLKCNRYFLFFLLSLSLVPYWFSNSRIIDLNGGCGNDGLTYCSMALGNIEFAPFSRRTLLPGLIHLLGLKNILYSFYFFNIVFILGSFILLYLIMKKVNVSYNYLVLSLFILNPHILRWLFSYPVMTDFLGLFIILAFIYFNINSENKNKYFITTSLLIILCFVRENAPITLSFGYLAWSVISKKEVKQNLIQFIISIIFTLISFNQPSTLNTVQETNFFKIAEDQLNYFLGDWKHFILFIFFFLYGFGVFSIASLSKLPRKENLFGGMYFSALIMLLSAPLLGGEARHFVIPGILMLIYFFSTKSYLNYVFVLLLVQISFWYLGAYADGTIESFSILFGQRFTNFENTVDLIKLGGVQLVVFGLIYLAFIVLKKVKTSL